MASVMFESHNFSGRFIRHQSFLGELTRIASDLDRRDSIFTIVPGLANPSDARLISFQSTNVPNHYLRHQNFRLVLHQPPADASQRQQFNADATFIQRPGLADDSTSSFISFNAPDRFIRHRDFHLFVEPRGTPNIESDATFYVYPPVILFAG